VLNGYSEQVLMNAGIQAIVATGLYLILLSGQLQAGQAAFVGIGAYASAALTAKFGIAFPIALLLAALLTFGVAAALAAVTLRLRHMFLAVATFAFGQVLVVALLNIPFLGQATGLYGMPIITSLWLVYGTLALVLWFAWRLENSRYGQALRALGEDELTAEAIGVDTRRLRILAFAIGSMIGGIGGVLYVHMLGLIAPDDVDFVRSATYLVYVVVGGVTTFWAPLIGTYVTISDWHEGCGRSKPEVKDGSTKEAAETAAADLAGIG
jgi:branched-chain amino acid transport system permease protein